MIFASSGCQDDCEPIDVDALNAIYLQFNTDGGPNSFTEAELDSVYFVRYQPAQLDSFLFPLDTFNLYEIGFTESDYRLRLSRGFPAGTPEGPPYYSEYAYRFVSRDEGFQVRLQSIAIDGGYVDDCIYEAREKSFQLNDDTLDLPGITTYVQVFKD
jgi:hypothetical protein